MTARSVSTQQPHSNHAVDQNTYKNHPISVRAQRETLFTRRILLHQGVKTAADFDLASALAFHLASTQLYPRLHHKGNSRHAVTQHKIIYWYKSSSSIRYTYTGRTYLAACFANKQHQRSLLAERESTRRVLYVVSCVKGGRGRGKTRA